MATTGVVNGTLIKLSLAGTNIAYLQSTDESLSTALRETTSKDSNGDAEFLGGKRSAEWTAKFLHVEGGTKGWDYCVTQWQAGNVLAGVMTSGVTGDRKYSANVLIKSMKRSAGMEANVEGDVTFQVTGAITAATI